MNGLDKKNLSVPFFLFLFKLRCCLLVRCVVPYHFTILMSARLAELSLEKGDRTGAAKRIDDILSNHGDVNNSESDLSPHYLLRAYLIGARAKKGGAAFFMLRKALTYAIRYGYPRFKALIKLEIAKLQVLQFDI